MAAVRVRARDVRLVEAVAARRVRREAARVYYRMAGVYLLLGDSKSAQQTLQKTKELQESLCEQFPDVTEYRHDLVKTVNFLGNAEVMQGQYANSKNMYEKAAKNAEALVQAFPDNIEFKITLVRTYLSLYQFNSHTNMTLALAYLTKASDISRKIYDADPKPYLNQLTYLTLLIEQAQLDFQDFAIVADAEATLEDGILTLRVDLRPPEDR